MILLFLGAADIFGMLVEVVATDQPKANLAIGQLLGKFLFKTSLFFEKPKLLFDPCPVAFRNKHLIHFRSYANEVRV